MPNPLKKTCTHSHSVHYSQQNFLTPKWQIKFSKTRICLGIWHNKSH